MRQDLFCKAILTFYCQAMCVVGFCSQIMSTFNNYHHQNLFIHSVLFFCRSSIFWIWNKLAVKLICHFNLHTYIHKYIHIYFYTKDVYECASNPCENNGTCFDLVNGYYCMCVPGYTDAQCLKGKKLRMNANVYECS